jgi:hypothetical protein
MSACSLVDLWGGHVLVPEPQGDDGDVVPYGQTHGCGMAQDVGVRLLLAQGSARAGCFSRVDGQALLQGVVGHEPAADGGEQRVVWCPGVFGERAGW